MNVERSFAKRIRLIQRLILIALMLLFIGAVAAFFVPIDQRYRASGMVVPKYSAVVYSPVDSFIERILVRSGDSVTSGQLMVVLHTGDLDQRKVDLINEGERLDAEIAERRAELERAKKDPLTAEFRHVDIGLRTAQARLDHFREYVRMLEQLAEEGIVSELEYKQAKLSEVQAEAELKRDEANRRVLDTGYAEDLIRQIELQIERLRTMRTAVDRSMDLLERQYLERRIVAPSDGLAISHEKSYVNEPVQRGEELYRIALSDEIEIRLYGPEHNVNRIQPGQQVIIESMVFSPYRYGYARGEVLSVARAPNMTPGSSESPAFGGPLYKINCSITRMPRHQTLPIGSSVAARITLRRSNLLRTLLGLDQDLSEVRN